LLDLQFRLGEFFLADFHQLRPFLIFGQKRFQRQVVGLHGLDNALELFQSLNGDAQTYQPFAIRIFQGLKPDIVAIQEFNYSNNTASDFRSMVDTAFGTNFVYYREPYTANGDIPNGIISRYPILNSGSWTDTVQSPNRGFAWAQIDLPGTNDLYVVSVHLLTSSASARSKRGRI
jgi:endonuclease/exonuclease/phosphatase family metal-dependent hydrolase